MKLPMMRFRMATMVLALAVAAPAMGDPASLNTPQSLSQSAPQAEQQVPGAAPPPHPTDAHSDEKQAYPELKKGDTLLAANVSLAFTDVSNGNSVEVGFDHVLSDDLQVGMLAGKKWMYYDAQYANIALYSSGLYVTLSRSLPGGLLVQLRGGAVQDAFTGPQGPKPADFLPQPTPNGRGGAFGVSMVATFDHLNHCVFGWERQYIGGRTNDVFTISWVLVGAVGVLAILR